MVQILDFEEPIFNLEQKVGELKEMSKGGQVDLTEEIRRLKRKVFRMQKDVFSRLTAWQKTQLARHPNRPYTKDYIKYITTEFIELHGDRYFADGHSIVGGPAKLEGKPVMLIGHQKGRDTKEKVFRNFGMSQPEGYRKALRLMKIAEKFNFPIITLLDTPGAYPGIEAEERGQAEAIARNIKEMSDLTVPVIAVIIGEGGSGGALALGVGNRVLMLKYSVYSVISPEGCAAILWNDPKKNEEAANALLLTSNDLLNLKVIDEILKEPPGGAHRNHRYTASNLKRVLLRHLRELEKLSPEELAKDRHEKFQNMGSFIEN